MLLSMQEDLCKLLDNSVEGIMFCNEGDRPYALKADLVAVAVMTRIISEVAAANPPIQCGFCKESKGTSGYCSRYRFLPVGFLPV
jgi:hypothetical protein